MAAKIKVKVEIGEGNPEAQIRSIENLFVLGPPGGIDDAEEDEFAVAGILDRLHGMGRDFDDIARLDRRLFIVDVHNPGAPQYVVQLIGGQPMSKGVPAGGHNSMGKGISGRERVIAVRMHQFTQARIVTGNDFATLAEFAYSHGTEGALR